jgi:hypothetical protein
MTEFYDEVSINHTTYHYEFSSISYWENKLISIQDTINQINIELPECIKKLEKSKKNVFITNENQIEMSQYKGILDANYEVDDALMEISEDLLMNHILNEDKKIYSKNTIDFLNTLFKFLTKNDYKEKPFTNYKESLINIKEYIKNNKISVEDLFFDYTHLIKSYTPTEYDFKYLSLLDKQNILAQGEEINCLIMYYQIIIVECYYNKINISSEIKEVKEDIEYLKILNMEKQEELRRCIIILKELRDEESKEVIYKKEEIIDNTN